MMDLDKVVFIQSKLPTLKKNEDLTTYLHSIVELIASTLDVYFVGIHLVDESRENLCLKAGSGIIGEKLLARGYQVRLAAVNPYMGQASTATYHGQIKLVDWLGNKISSYLSVGESISELEPEAISNRYFRSPVLPQSRIELYLPLQNSNTTIGVLELSFNTQIKFSEDEIWKLQKLANAIALEI